MPPIDAMGLVLFDGKPAAALFLLKAGMPGYCEVSDASNKTQAGTVSQRVGWFKAFA